MPDSPVFIGGAGRSGTTLLRVILDSHPHIACGPELKILPLISAWWHECQTKYSPFLRNYAVTDRDTNALFATLILGILDKYRLQQGKQRIAEKSPNNISAFFPLHNLFPESPLIHVIRDGRDVIASLLTMDWKTADGKPLAYTRDPVAAAQYWVNCIRAGQQFRDALPAGQSTYMEIRYEEMISAPETTLKALFAFIGEPWSDAVLSFHNHQRDLAGESSAAQVSQPIYPTAVQRWRKDLTAQQLQQIKPIITDTLVALGYEKNHTW